MNDDELRTKLDELKRQYYEIENRILALANQLPNGQGDKECDCCCGDAVHFTTYWMGEFELEKDTVCLNCGGVIYG